MHLAPFLNGVDVAKVKRHQRELVIAAIGRLSAYTGRTVRSPSRNECRR
jgi:hypothetical protein